MAQKVVTALSLLLPHLYRVSDHFLNHVTEIRYLGIIIQSTLRDPTPADYEWLYVVCYIRLYFDCFFVTFKRNNWTKSVNGLAKKACFIVNYFYFDYMPQPMPVI